jgi:AcrR family transcriptional regulator
VTAIARTPGRPRSALADESIVEAVVELAAQGGLEALTVEGVAARAGVGKNTVYRRYPNKIELVVGAVRWYANTGAPPPDTGTTRADLRALVDEHVEIVTATPLGRLVPMLVAARTRVPELGAAYADIVAERRARSAVVVRRAIGRGDLRADVEVDAVIDWFTSPVFYRLLISDDPLDARFCDGVVDATLRAFG